VSSRWGPLASRNFRLLLACDVISYLGSAMAGVALPFAVLAIGLAGTLSLPFFAIWQFALAAPVGLPVVAAAAAAAGFASEVFAVNWITTMQQEIPPNLLSRLTAYDFLGSQALAPAGTALAGPLAAAFGTATVLAVGGAAIIALTIPVLLVPEVRHLRRRPVQPAPSPDTVSGQRP
jgi:hypothetical protein